MDKHWVEELFPPTYAYSIDELMKSTTIAEDKPDVASSTAGPRPSTTSQPKHSVKDLYERVRVDFNQEVEERRQKSVQVGIPLSFSEDSVVTDGKDSPDKVLTLRKDKEDLELDTECIWSQSELQILRNAYEKAKTDRAHIAIQLRMFEVEKKKVEEQVKEQEMKLKKLMKSLHQSQQECKRLTLRCGHLESELRHSNGKVRMLEEDVTDLFQEKRTLKKVLREVQKELIQERRVRTDVELRLQEDSRKLKLEHIATEDELKLDYQMQINRLEEELRETQEALEKEQKAHSINKKALDHLRIHFASLQSAGQTERVESGHDRLTNIKY